MGFYCSRFTIPIGSDFLHHFNLLVDMRKRRFIDANTELSVAGCKANTSPISPVFFIAADDDPYQTRLRSYPELTNLNFFVSKSTHSSTLELFFLALFGSHDKSEST